MSSHIDRYIRAVLPAFDLSLEWNSFFLTTPNVLEHLFIYFILVQCVIHRQHGRFKSYRLLLFLQQKLSQTLMFLAARFLLSSTFCYLPASCPGRIGTTWHIMGTVPPHTAHMNELQFFWSPSLLPFHFTITIFTSVDARMKRAWHWTQFCESHNQWVRVDSHVCISSLGTRSMLLLVLPNSEKYFLYFFFSWVKIMCIGTFLVHSHFRKNIIWFDCLKWLWLKQLYRR